MRNYRKIIDKDGTQSLSLTEISGDWVYVFENIWLGTLMGNICRNQAEMWNNLTGIVCSKTIMQIFFHFHSFHNTNLFRKTT